MEDGWNQATISYLYRGWKGTRSSTNQAFQILIKLTRTNGASFKFHINRKLCKWL